METPYTVAAYVLARVQAALGVAGRDIDPDAGGTAQVVVGGFLTDVCDGGALLVMVERVWRTIPPFPTEAVADSQCDGNPIAVALAVGVWRCVPIMGDDGSLPPADVQEAAHRGIYDDAAVVWNELAGVGILGTDPHDQWETRYERASLSQLFAPLEGGVGGSETRITLGVPWAEWCLTDPVVED